MMLLAIKKKNAQKRETRRYGKRAYGSLHYTISQNKPNICLSHTLFPSVRACVCDFHTPKNTMQRLVNQHLISSLSVKKKEKRFLTGE